MLPPISPSDRLPADTLRANTALIDEWRQQADFDYARDLTDIQQSPLDWLLQQLNHLLHELFGSGMSESSEHTFQMVCFVVVAALLVWVIVKVRPRLLFGEGKPADDFQLEEDTIYGVDFDALLAEARRQGNHRETVRLLYLQTLKALSDAGSIDWQPSKTPSQYTREHTSAPFRQMTHLFLLVRYGNQEADDAMAAQTEAWQRQVADALPAREKGGRP